MKFFCNISFNMLIDRSTVSAILYSCIDNVPFNSRHKILRHSLLINNFFIENNVRICDDEFLQFKNLLSLDFVGKTIQVF